MRRLGGALDYIVKGDMMHIQPLATSRKRRRGAVALIGALAIALTGVIAPPAAAWGDSQPPPGVKDTHSTTLTENAQTSLSRRMNGNAHQQGPILSHKGWQYTAFYTESGEVNEAGAPVRHVSVARRELPAGGWDVMTLNDYPQTKDDAHNVVAIGLSASDGSIHLAFDMHAEPLNYRHSIPGVLDDPATTAWSPDLFGPVQDFLEESGTVVDRVTYPRFVMKPDGGLLLELRKGGSGSGDSHLWDYDDGAWEARGAFVSGTSDDTTRPDENAYYNAIQYDGNGRLHATWTWRETPDPVTNHDLMYLYSDDDGRTWHRNDGQQVAVTGVNPVRPDTPGVTVWEIPQGSDVGNQEGQWVDREGRVHVTMRDDDSGVREHVHYFRDLDGTWHQQRTGIVHTGRSKIVTDNAGNAYILTAGLQILAATSASNFTDWHVVQEPVDGLGPEPLFDPVLATEQGVLSVFIPEVLPGGFAPSTGTIFVKDFQFIYPAASLEIALSGELTSGSTITVSAQAIDAYGASLGPVNDDITVASSADSDAVVGREVRLGDAGDRRLTVALNGTDVTGYIDFTVPGPVDPEPGSIYPGTFLGDSAGRYVATQSMNKVKATIQTGCAAWNDSAYIGVHVTAIQHSNRPYEITLEGSHQGYKKDAARTVELRKQVGSTAYVGINSDRTVRPAGTITVTIEREGAEPQLLTFERPKVNCNKEGAIDVAF